MNQSAGGRKFSAIIFDLDGTLAHTFPAVIRIFNRITASRLGRIFSLAEMAPYFGPPETVAFKGLFPEDAEHRAVVEEFYQQLRDDGHDIKAFDGARELLTDLRADNRHLAVYTGASAEAARIRIGHAGLLDLFDEILGGDQVARYKPDPEGVVRLIEHFRACPQETVYIGDMVSDVMAGRAAGAATIAVTWGAGRRKDLAAANPDYLIDDPKELTEILK
ncbi:MAG TPA: HAD-IA family hydrolase [Blastocatellia bacterium]|nr:HAD-IA family hydrolase [Blastocatellia bacterium]